MVIANCLLSNPITANIDLSSVTPAQLGKAHKILSSKGNFYKVENSEGKINDAGELIEYTVTFDEQGPHCTCRAGQEGFARCRNYCWHVRASLACEMELNAAMAEQAIAQASQIIKEAQAKPQEPVYIYTEGKVLTPDDETYQRVMNAKPRPVNKRAKGFSAKPFSILR